MCSASACHRSDKRKLLDFSGERLTMKTEVVKVDARDEAKIRAAAKVLDEGGLVAFPTETVYGIGCAAQREAIARLNAVK